MRKGYSCSVCKAASDTGRLAFSINVHVLVDLVQQSFHSQSPTGPLGPPEGSDIGTVLYYCTLREALLNAFLRELLLAQKIADALIAKLFDDNKLASQKFGGLFAAIVGVKWEQAVAAVSQANGRDFSLVSNLMKRAAALRNEFLHEGRGWGVNREFATECVDSLGDLLNLFVSLHNEYIHPRLIRSA